MGGAAGRKRGCQGCARREPNVSRVRRNGDPNELLRRIVPAQAVAGVMRHRQPRCERAARHDRSGSPLPPTPRRPRHCHRSQNSHRLRSEPSERHPFSLTPARTPAEKDCTAESPTRRSIRSPRHSRKAAPTRAGHVFARVGCFNTTAQHGHDIAGQRVGRLCRGRFGGTLVHLAARKLCTGRNGIGQMTERGRSEERQMLIFGPDNTSPLVVGELRSTSSNRFWSSPSARLM